jgi:hypothetical protein
MIRDGEEHLHDSVGLPLLLLPGCGLFPGPTGIPLSSKG